MNTNVGPTAGSAHGDLQLARLARRGDRHAMEALAARLGCVRDHLGAAHARLGRPLGEHDLADVLGDVHASLWSRLERFDGRRPLEAWASGFCGIQLVKHLERRRRRRQLEYGLDPDRHDPRQDPKATSEEDGRALREALARLDPRTFDVVQLKVIEERTFEEIGAALCMSPNTAKSLYYRALARLRRRLEGRISEASG